MADGARPGRDRPVHVVLGRRRPALHEPGDRGREQRPGAPTTNRGCPTEGIEHMTAEQWDVRWHRIYTDALADFDERAAREIANDETVIQFGLRPEEASR